MKEEVLASGIPENAFSLSVSVLAPSPSQQRRLSTSFAATVKLWFLKYSQALAVQQRFAAPSAPVAFQSRLATHLTDTVSVTLDAMQLIHNATPTPAGPAPDPNGPGLSTTAIVFFVIGSAIVLLSLTMCAVYTLRRRRAAPGRLAVGSTVADSSDEGGYDDHEDEDEDALSGGGHIELSPQPPASSSFTTTSSVPLNTTGDLGRITINLAPSHVQRA